MNCTVIRDHVRPAHKPYRALRVTRIELLILITRANLEYRLYFGSKTAVMYLMKHSFYEHSDYRALIKERIERLPAKGRGEYRRIATSLRMHTTRVSHIFKGKESLTLEQAALLCAHFGFSELESEYFVSLVAIERAGNNELKKILRKRLEHIREQSLEMAKRLPVERTLSEEQKIKFYSVWFFSAIRLLSSLPGSHTVESIATRLNLPKATVADAVEFLVSAGLCDSRGGIIQMGPKSTHLPASHLMVSRLHANWRQKALENHSKLSATELAITAPMSIPIKDFPVAREILAQAAEQIIKIASTTEQPDQLACLTIDWFKF